MFFIFCNGSQHNKVNINWYQYTILCFKFCNGSWQNKVNIDMSLLKFISNSEMEVDILSYWKVEINLIYVWLQVYSIPCNERWHNKVNIDSHMSLLHFFTKFCNRTKHVSLNSFQRNSNNWVEVKTTCSNTIRFS